MAEQQAERREIQRRTTLKGGRIVFHAGRSTIDCRVRNLSAKGAKLIVASIVGIPDEFELRMDDHQLRHACRIIWRKPTELGVEFVLDA